VYPKMLPLDLVWVNCNGMPLARPKSSKMIWPRSASFRFLRLDVTVDDGRLLRMQIVECIEQLVSPSDYFIERKRRGSAFQCLCQIFAGYVLHYQELTILFW
jgi:hypothetical protein